MWHLWVSECVNLWFHSYRWPKRYQILMSLGHQCMCISFQDTCVCFNFKSTVEICRKRGKRFPSLSWRQIVIFEFALSRSHIAKRRDSGYQIISFWSVFFNASPCVAWAVLKGWFTLLCWSLKFRNSSKMCSANGFKRFYYVWNLTP